MVSLVSTGAIIQNIAVTGVVNVLPTVNPIPDQTVNNGAATTAINFTGTANTFTWVNDTPGIGLPASGTGNIASLTAINNGSIPVTAHITVTPISSGFAYIANGTSNSVSVINTTTNQVVATIPMGTFTFPAYVSVSPDGSRIYVTDINSNSISVIDAATNTVLSTTGGDAGSTLVVSPDGSRVYMVAGPGIYEINTATNAVLAYITVSGSPPWHVFELGWQPYVHGEL
jgi:YVTN family beta-propeller protein